MKNYTGLDRFGRLTRQKWDKYTATTATLWHANHNYDRNSNRLYRDMQTPGTGRDELYAYDGLDRLTDTQRGSIASPFTSVTSGTFRHNFGYDQLGNWSTFKEYASSTTTVTLDQTRTHNKANELGVIGATVGANWADPTHDAAGNMTSLPQPNPPTSSYGCRYDAWNRLVKVSDPASGGQTVAEYQYDGLGRRIVKLIYNAGVLSETRHQYWSQGWQLLEERVGTTPGTARVDTSYVWGQRYIDELVSRDRDADASGGTGTGGMEERLFALHDSMFSVTAMVNTSGAVVERYDYTPYGERKVFDAAWAPRTSSTIASNIAHQGIYQDAETGLNQNRYRIGDQLTGRWIQSDPLGYIDGANLYEMSRSNPVNGADALGLRTAAPPPVRPSPVRPGPLWPENPPSTRPGWRPSYPAEPHWPGPPDFGWDRNRPRTVPHPGTCLSPHGCSGYPHEPLLPPPPQSPYPPAPIPGIPHPSDPNPNPELTPELIDSIFGPKCESTEECKERCWENYHAEIEGNCSGLRGRDFALCADRAYWNRSSCIGDCAAKHKK